MLLAGLTTPCLLLERRRMERNIARLRSRLASQGVRLRPHLKTARSLPIARLLMDSPAGPATVSTLSEAEAFAAAGVRDLVYAVGIVPAKLPRVRALRRRGVDIAVVLDSCEQAEAVCAVAARGDPVPALVEIDTDGHRAGLCWDDPRLLDVAGMLHRAGALRGVLTHAGGSYDARGEAALLAAAAQERDGAVRAAGVLRAAGLACPVVSVGSTPTAHFARDLTGVTEVRAGVFVFHDLVMAGLGVCGIDDIAISVLTSVIGYQHERGQLLVDAGWMALSRDRGTASQPVDQGYGLVCDASGEPIPDLIVQQVNQEHGVVGVRQGSSRGMPRLPVGSLLRILPNHACATAAQHREYLVLEGGTVVDRWPRIPPGW